MFFHQLHGVTGRIGLCVKIIVSSASYWTQSAVVFGMITWIALPTSTSQTIKRNVRSNFAEILWRAKPTSES